MLRQGLDFVLFLKGQVAHLNKDVPIQIAFLLNTLAK